MDYNSNSRKSKEDSPEEIKPKKSVQKVVTSEVTTKKRSLGRKTRDAVIGADIKSVISYVCADVLIPAARNTIVDMTSKGIERMMYGETAVHRRPSGPRITYNKPASRSPHPSYQRHQISSRQVQRAGQDDIILVNREEAELVLDNMQEILSIYEVVSVADLKELIGQPITSVDNGWGWESLVGSKIRPLRQGYLIDLPPAVPI